MIKIISVGKVKEKFFKEAIDEYLKRLSKYTKIDWQPTINSYWHSTEQIVQVTWVELSKSFVSSKLFTKEELPVGTIIEIKSGYQYRPDGYITKGQILTGVARPGNVSTQYVEITDEWWGSFNYRGFNISSTAGGSLEGKTDQAIAAFNIYIPKN